jgi:peptidoglycan/xylan/chitin deacetylase (PgdA/CDA1 family)
VNDARKEQALSARKLAPSRRLLLTAPLLLAAASAPAASAAAPFEVHMRLARPAPGGLDVALTFDACPGAFDRRIADALVEEAVPATIFLTAIWMRRNPRGLAFLLAHRDLFALENHGYWHVPPILGARRIFGLAVAGDLDRVREEAVRGAEAVAAAVGARPLWYRGAAGYYSRPALAMLRGMGFAIAGYSLNADVGASLPADAVARRIAEAANGAVVVAHINQPNRASGAGVVAGIGALKRRGARFLRLDALSAADVFYG